MVDNFARSQSVDLSKPNSYMNEELNHAYEFYSAHSTHDRLGTKYPVWKWFAQSNLRFMILFFVQIIIIFGWSCCALYTTKLDVYWRTFGSEEEGEVGLGLVDGGGVPWNHGIPSFPNFYEHSPDELFLAEEKTLFLVAFPGAMAATHLVSFLWLFVAEPVYRHMYLLSLRFTNTYIPEEDKDNIFISLNDNSQSLHIVHFTYTSYIACIFYISAVTFWYDGERGYLPRSDVLTGYYSMQFLAPMAFSQMGCSNTVMWRMFRASTVCWALYLWGIREYVSIWGCIATLSAFTLCTFFEDFRDTELSIAYDELLKKYTGVVEGSRDKVPHEIAFTVKTIHSSINRLANELKQCGVVEILKAPLHAPEVREISNSVAQASRVPRSPKASQQQEARQQREVRSPTASVTSKDGGNNEINEAASQSESARTDKNSNINSEVNTDSSLAADEGSGSGRSSVSGSKPSIKMKGNADNITKTGNENNEKEGTEQDADVPSSTTGEDGDASTDKSSDKIVYGYKWNKTAAHLCESRLICMALLLMTGTRGDATFDDYGSLSEKNFSFGLMCMRLFTMVEASRGRCLPLYICDRTSEASIVAKKGLLEIILLLMIYDVIPDITGDNTGSLRRANINSKSTSANTNEGRPKGRAGGSKANNPSSVNENENESSLEPDLRSPTQIIDEAIDFTVFTGFPGTGNGTTDGDGDGLAEQKDGGISSSSKARRLNSNTSGDGLNNKRGGQKSTKARKEAITCVRCTSADGYWTITVSTTRLFTAKESLAHKQNGPGLDAGRAGSEETSLLKLASELSEIYMGNPVEVGEFFDPINEVSITHRSIRVYGKARSIPRIHVYSKTLTGHASWLIVDCHTNARDFRDYQVFMVLLKTLGIPFIACSSLKELHNWKLQHSIVVVSDTTLNSKHMHLLLDLQKVTARDLVVISETNPAEFYKSHYDIDVARTVTVTAKSILECAEALLKKQPATLVNDKNLCSFSFSTANTHDYEKNRK